MLRKATAAKAVVAFFVRATSGASRLWAYDLVSHSGRNTMNRVRFTLFQLMAVVLYFGFGVAALRNADDFWASATYTLAITMIALAVVRALARKGGARTAWAGFAVFGWTYLLVNQLPDWGSGGLGFGPIPKPFSLIESGFALLQPHIHPTPGGLDLAPYAQISYSLGIISFGLVGALLGGFPRVKDERPNP
jgi:hypothetical protein